MPLFPSNTGYIDEETVDIITDLLDRRYPSEAIARTLLDHYYPVRPPDFRTSDKLRSFRSQVKRVKEDRWNWCTKKSTIGMELAFCGNKGAWDELNYYERRDVILRIQNLFDSGRSHPSILGGDDGTPWLQEFCRRVGITDNTIYYTCGRRQRIAGKAKP